MRPGKSGENVYDIFVSLAFPFGIGDRGALVFGLGLVVLTSLIRFCCACLRWDWILDFDTWKASERASDIVV
ncbi:hypothetical protein DL95DRAFT_95605 [Leptodontidium sp. 2 PMI_412]|nr:hypothetical protein DL95DRAFT_95605 [Leptodontidium sp. 2 PMI_412]